MKLYKLTPVDEGFGGWKCSAYRGGVIVRAATEEQARLVAARGFARSTLVRVGDASSSNPWSEKAVVEVTEVQDSRFSPAGIAEVLDPQGY